MLSRAAGIAPISTLIQKALERKVNIMKRRVERGMSVRSLASDNSTDVFVLVLMKFLLLANC